MEKALFSITCTTCQARLVVRSEAAIGTILECPRCQSMVLIAPPPGWRSPSELQSADASAPPPLDRVATEPLSVELDLPKTSVLKSILGSTGFLWGAAMLTVLLIVAGLWQLLAPESAGVVESSPPTAQNTPAAEPKTTEIASDDSKLPRSKPPAETKEENENVGGDAGPSKVAESPLTSPSKPPEASPASAELFPKFADMQDEEPAPLEVKKASPVPVNVAERLNEPIRQLELTAMPLVEAIDLLASMGAVPTTIDCDALQLLGVALNQPISLRLEATTIGEAMQAVAAQKGLAVTVEADQVLVTSPAEYRETTRKMRYTIGDLTGGDRKSDADFAEILQKLIQPDSWRPAGGRGTIESGGGSLTVVQTPEVHRQILVFCEKLRNARHLPLRSRDDPTQFALTTRWNKALKTLDKPVSCNFHEPATLSRILAFLADAAGCDILVDHAALAAAETSDGVATTLSVTNQPLGKTLNQLLRPLGLTYRTVGANALQITTREAAEERMEIEFYPVAHWLGGEDAARAAEGQTAKPKGELLADRLKGRVAPSTWSDVGGAGEIYFDPPSKCLVVLQSQPAQRRIERLLAAPAQKPKQ